MSKLDKLAASLLMLAAMSAGSAAAAANFPVGTHLVKGTLKDWQNKVLTSSAAVESVAVVESGICSRKL